MRYPSVAAILCAAALFAVTGCSTRQPAAVAPASAPVAAETTPVADPFANTPQLEEAVRMGLVREIAYLGEFESSARKKALKRCTAGQPVAMRNGWRTSAPKTLRDYATGRPIAYLVPVLLDGEPVGEFELDVDHGKLLSANEAMYVSGVSQWPAHMEAERAVRRALGPDAHVAHLGSEPYTAVVGWSERGEAMAFAQFRCGTPDTGAVTPPTAGIAYTGDDAKAYADLIFVLPPDDGSEQPAR